MLLTDARGLPLGYTIVPANENEYEPLADLLTGTPAEVVIADKGFWGRDYRARLAADGTTLLTPDKTRTAANLGRERALASTRLVIESVFANLKGQMRLEHHLAKTPAGLAVRIAQRILALTHRNPAQHPHRPPRTRPRRLRRPLNHIKPLVVAGVVPVADRGRDPGAVALVTVDRDGVAEMQLVPVAVVPLGAVARLEADHLVPAGVDLKPVVTRRGASDGTVEREDVVVRLPRRGDGGSAEHGKGEHKSEH